MAVTHRSMGQNKTNFLSRLYMKFKLKELFEGLPGFLPFVKYFSF
jgi:hypothetical protein